MRKFAVYRQHLTDHWIEGLRTDMVWDHVMTEGTDWTKNKAAFYESMAWSWNEQDDQGPVWPVFKLFDNFADALAMCKRQRDTSDHVYYVASMEFGSEVCE